MREVTMSCTTCPSGCALVVLIDDENQVAKVTGNNCPRGEVFANKEWTHPERMLTSTVLGCVRGIERLLPVKSKEPIPKDTMKKAMQEIQEVYVDGPVTMGDVIIEDLAGTGIPLVACKTVE